MKMNTYDKFNQTVNKHNICTAHINWEKIHIWKKGKQQIDFSHHQVHEQSTKTCYRIAVVLLQMTLFRPLSPKSFLTALLCRQVCYFTPSQTQPHGPLCPLGWILAAPRLSHVFLTFPNRFAVCKPLHYQTQELRKHTEQTVKAQEKYTS